ncbi:MAG: hypothetical protein JOS17DRAFT_775154 [Linnemannia elongata]|nr:MAG: hypothetical protein JOS17DRAFT_775154 [Linnemannia elongata]
MALKVECKLKATKFMVDCSVQKTCADMRGPLNAIRRASSEVELQLCLRIDYHHTNTNNLVESWHKTLKRQHLGYERDLHADDLICLLQGVVDVDFRATHFKITHGLQPIVLSQYGKANKAKAMALAFDVAGNMVSKEAEQFKRILKFHRTRKKYGGSANVDRCIRHKVRAMQAYETCIKVKQ